MKLPLLLLSTLALVAQSVDLYPRKMSAFTVATLPTVGAGYVAVVTDAATAGSCTVGSGSELALCRYSGSAWVSLGGASFVAGTGITCVGSTCSADSAVVEFRSTQQAGTSRYGRSTTGNDTYVVSLTPSLTAYTRGGCIVLDADAANTGAATINVDTLGTKSILTRSGAALSDGDITANKPSTICYDGTQYIIQGDGGGSTVTAAGPYLALGSSYYIPSEMFSATRPASSGWTTEGTISSSSQSNQARKITLALSTRGGEYATAGAWTSLVMAMRCNMSVSASNAVGQCGMYVRNSAGTEVCRIYMAGESTSSFNTAYAKRSTSYAATTSDDGNGRPMTGTIHYFKIAMVSGISYYYSNNGDDWELIGNVGNSAVCGDGAGDVFGFEGLGSQVNETTVQLLHAVVTP